jgi:cyclophilin family peptidyl-prolyl cis-trans isomerase
MARTRVYLDFDTHDQPAASGRVVVELFDDLVPRAAENFRLLCSGEAGRSYRGCAVYRAIRGFLLQTGDVGRNDGTGGACAVDAPRRFFESEAGSPGHAQPWRVGMAALEGVPHSNGSDFYVTLCAAPFLDAGYVVCGHVVRGHRVLVGMDAAIARVAPPEPPLGFDEETPLRRAVIAGCGVLTPAQCAADDREDEADAADA